MARPPDRESPSRPPAYPPSHQPQTRPPSDPALQQRAWAALMLAVISLCAMLMIGNVRRAVYVIAVVALIAATAVWLATSAMARARRGGSGRPYGVVLATVLGVLGLLVSVTALAVFAMFGPQLTQYSNCVSAANTYAAQQACRQQLNDSVGIETGVLGG